MPACVPNHFGLLQDTSQPVNMVGFVAGGLLWGDHPQTDWDSVAAVADKPLLVDVRTPIEFASGHMPYVLNIPVDNLRIRLGELTKERTVVAYCQVGQRG